MRNPSTIDAYFTEKLLPALMELGINESDLAPLGAVIAERGVTTETQPSAWTEAEQKIVLEVLREFLEASAYEASGETVPERVLREIGDVMRDVRGKLNQVFTDPAKDPTLTVEGVMYSIYTYLIKVGVPEEAMQRIGAVMGEFMMNDPRGQDFAGVSPDNMNSDQAFLYLEWSEMAIRQVA